MFVLLPISFIIDLDALTIPSEPYPYIKNSLELSILYDSSTLRLLFVTSSSIPIVKSFIGLSNISYTAFICLGVVFLLDSPYLPPTIFMFLSFRAATTSKYSGSPILPGSFVLSSTAILSADSGITLIKYSLENGLYKCTSTNP